MKPTTPCKTRRYDTVQYASIRRLAYVPATPYMNIPTEHLIDEALDSNNPFIIELALRFNAALTLLQHDAGCKLEQLEKEFDSEDMGANVSPI